jgi:L,D-peptidoglycan transpeptidase YkuD (ErfK/YbiS/YcfS/YnhG family)
MSTARVFAEGRLMFGRRVCRVALGRGGVVAHKQEGDGGTPRGVLTLRRVLYRADRVGRPRCVVPVEPIAPQDGWCDDPDHRDYNKMVRLPHEGRHEALWRRDGVYDLIGVLGWNDAPVVRGQGSAIFLHIARPDFAPTEGCVALAMEDMTAILADGLDGLEVE